MYSKVAPAKEDSKHHGGVKQKYFHQFFSTGEKKKKTQGKKGNACSLKYSFQGPNRKRLWSFSENAKKWPWVFLLIKTYNTRTSYKEFGFKMHERNGSSFSFSFSMSSDLILATLVRVGSRSCSSMTCLKSTARSQALKVLSVRTVTFLLYLVFKICHFPWKQKIFRNCSFFPVLRLILKAMCFAQLLRQLQWTPTHYISLFLFFLSHDCSELVVVFKPNSKCLGYAFFPHLFAGIHSLFPVVYSKGSVNYA